MDRYILDDDKNVTPCPDLTTWGEWMETGDRIVAKTQVLDCEISTVFLGVDHNFYGENEPVVFETLVFGGELADEMTRCSTYKDALLQHAAMLSKVLEVY